MVSLQKNESVKTTLTKWKITLKMSKIIPERVMKIIPKIKMTAQNKKPVLQWAPKMKFTLVGWFSLFLEWFSHTLEWFSFILRVILTWLEWVLHVLFFFKCNHFTFFTLREERGNSPNKKALSNFNLSSANHCGYLTISFFPIFWTCQTPVKVSYILDHKTFMSSN